MANFLKKVFGKGEEKHPDSKLQQNGSVSAVDEPLEVAKLTEMFRYFPLGEKVQYYPEYQKRRCFGNHCTGLWGK